MGNRYPMIHRPNANYELTSKFILIRSCKRLAQYTSILQHRATPKSGAAIPPTAITITICMRELCLLSQQSA